MRMHFLSSKFSHAIVESIQEVGKVLATHFPRTSASTNELPDQVIEE
jgi:uncharacterized membrane protein